MRHLRLALLPLVFTACSEQSTVASLDQGPEFNFSNAPAESGIVVRGETAVGLTWVDVDAGLRVVLGADLNEFCAAIVDFDIIALQDANLPSGRTVSLAAGEVQTTVWDFLAFDCDLFTTIAPVAWGSANLQNNDNDLAGSVVNNTNTWGWTAQGMLAWTADGSPATFSGFVRQQFGNNSGPKVVSKINLN